MKASASVSRTLDLPGGSLVPFFSMPGERVRILAGRVWLTEEGSPNDAFLASGDEVRLGNRGLAVIEALAPARIQLYEDANVASRLARGARVLAGRLADAARRVARAPRPIRSPA
jgi:hypothetical protein